MIALRAVWGWLKKAGLWAKGHWQVLAAAAGILLVLLLRRRGSAPAVADGAIVGHDQEQAAADAKAAQEKAQADAAEAAKLQQVTAEQTTAQSTLVIQITDEANVADADPAKVNELLLDVGKDIRK